MIGCREMEFLKVVNKNRVEDVVTSEECGVGNYVRDPRVACQRVRINNNFNTLFCTSISIASSYINMVNARAEAVPPSSVLTETLPAQLPPIFEQAQHTTANHRKNIVALRKIQVACAKITEETSKGTKLVGEKAFNTMFVDMVNRVLGVKKGVAVADRVIKFVANYVAYSTEQGESCQ